MCTLCLILLVIAFYLSVGIGFLCYPKAVNEWIDRHPWFWLSAGMFDTEARIAIIRGSGVIATMAGTMVALFMLLHWRVW